MLVKLPNGDWINPSTIASVRLMVGDGLGPRAVIDTAQHYGHHMIEFDNPETARDWAEKFGRECNAALAASSKDPANAE